MKKNILKKGFTLVELLIAMSIFMIFMVVVSNSYIDIIRAQKTANETRLIYTELREFVDIVNNEMREGEIDYFCYDTDSENAGLQAFEKSRCGDSTTFTIETGNNLRTISKDGLRSSMIVFIPPENQDESGMICQQKYVLGESGGWVKDGNSEEDCGSGLQELAFKNLKVNNLYFEILPKKDPSIFSRDNLYNQIQPMVRMYADIGSKVKNVHFDFKFQTSFTSRNN